MLAEILEGIQPLNETAMIKQTAYMDALVKPIGSLGRLEEIAIILSGITGKTDTALRLDKKALIVMCADHGVCAEGIASAPQVVTYIQAENIALGKSGAGAIAKQLGAKIVTIDIGIDSEKHSPLLIDKRIANGSDNIAVGPAMTLKNAQRAIEVGIESAIETIEKGVQVLAIGEMGIGNTTPSTALLCAITGIGPECVTGVGANLPVDKLPHKIAVIQRALEANASAGQEPLARLAALGGYDIAGMTGVLLGAAYKRTPVVIDGYIATLSAILAAQFNPLAKNYFLASHASHETGAARASEALGLRPYFNMDMRLGEGSGALLTFPLIDAACALSQHMTTFESASIPTV